MKRLLPTLMAFSLIATSTHASTLADAAQQQAKGLQAGCIVTAELIGGKTAFAIAGKAPEAKDTPPEKIVFEIGSITKVFTGLLLAQAVVDKKVTLDTTIASLLDPQLKFADPRVAAITLKQLSTHTSGLPRLATNAAAGMAEDDPYAHYDEKLLLAYLQGEKLEGEGPYASSYSNVGVGLLGYLLGKVYGTSWEEAVVAKVCLPLGLQDTSVHPQDLPVATPHSGKKVVKPWHFDALGGAGALRSTAADILRLGEAFLHSKANPALRSAFSLALQDHADVPSSERLICLGIFFGKRDGDFILHHDGGTGGYRSSLQIIPSKQIVRVVLISNDDLDGSEVIAATSDKKATVPVAHKEITLPAETMAQYPGVYELDRDSRFTVILHEDQLWLRLTGQSFLRAPAMAPDRFFNTAVAAVAAEVAFNRDKDQKIQSLTLFQNGRELTAKRTGEPPPKITLHKPSELRPYVGEYALMGLKKITVTIRGSTLLAQMEGQPALPVFDTGPDRFEYDLVKAALIFTRDDNKNINGLTLQQNGLVLPAARVTSPPSSTSKK